MDVFAGQPQRSFADLAAVAGPARNTLSELRRFCLGLGDNTVEHVRAHRVVFGRSMAMRWFADISADNGTVMVKVNEGRRREPTLIEVRTGADTGAARDAIAAAYARV